METENEKPLKAFVELNDGQVLEIENVAAFLLIYHDDSWLTFPYKDKHISKSTIKKIKFSTEQKLSEIEQKKLSQRIKKYRTMLGRDPGAGTVKVWIDRIAMKIDLYDPEPRNVYFRSPKNERKIEKIQF